MRWTRISVLSMEYGLFGGCREGGAVYHDTGNLNYSFIIDKTEAPLSHRFLDPVVEVLHRMGIPAEIRKRKDLWLDGYKVSGTASHVSRGEGSFIMAHCFMIRICRCSGGLLMHKTEV